MLQWICLHGGYGDEVYTPPPLPFCPTQLLVEQKKAKKLIMYWGKDRILS